MNRDKGFYKRINKLNQELEIIFNWSKNIYDEDIKRKLVNLGSKLYVQWWKDQTKYKRKNNDG